MDYWFFMGIGTKIDNFRHELNKKIHQRLNRNRLCNCFWCRELRLENEEKARMDRWSDEFNRKRLEKIDENYKNRCDHEITEYRERLERIGANEIFCCKCCKKELSKDNRIAFIYYYRPREPTRGSM